MLDAMIDMVAQKVGIDPAIIRIAIPLVSKFLLQKSQPDAASTLLSSLPSDITGMFSDSEKSDFTTTQQNLTEEDMINILDSQCGINDKAKSQQVITQTMIVLQQNSIQQGEGDDLFGKTLGSLGKSGFNPFG